MKRAILVFLLVCPTAIAGTHFVVPVATAKYKDRVYSTTVAIKNSGSRPVPCNMSHTPVNRQDALTTTEVAPAGKTLVIEDFLKVIGAIGSATIDCSGDVIVAVRIQDSFDEGKTFRAGWVFGGMTATHVITEGQPETITTQSNIALVDVGGKHSKLAVRVTNASGAILAEMSYDMPPRAFQLVNLGELVGHGDLHVRVAVKGAGSVAFARASNDPTLTTIAVRMPDASRPAAEAHFARQRQLRTLAEAAHSVSLIAPLSPFKGAAFEDPMTGLILMRRRWYEPRTGTFISPDPSGNRDSPNLFAFCAGDPVNCSDPTGERAMTADDRRQLAMLKARGKRLYSDFRASGRAMFSQYMLVPVDRPWWSTGGAIGGDYVQELVASTVTTEAAYQWARRSMVNDVATFERAVARADANGEINYVAGQGFTTITTADQNRAKRSTMLTTGIFFATDGVPMMLSPYAMRGGIVQPAELPKAYRQDILVLGHYRGYVDLADELGAHRFDLRSEVWNRMTPAERQAANVLTLDRAIARGAEIRLSTPPNQARPGSAFEDELVYLYLRGYTASADGTRLIPPPVGCAACSLIPQQKR